MHLLFIFLFCTSVTHSAADEPFFQCLKDLPFIGRLFESQQETALRQAKSVAAAQLLINNGALQNASVRRKQFLCRRLAFQDREPELITLYKKHGLNVTLCYDDNYTLLMDLVSWPSTIMITKAGLILEDLTQEQLKQFLSIKTNNLTKLNVFDMIKYKKNEWHTSPEHVAYLDAYQDFLIKKMSGEDNCSICLDPLNAEPTCTLTLCGHIFHQECLRSSISHCPLCRCYLYN